MAIGRVTITGSSGHTFTMTSEDMSIPQVIERLPNGIRIHRTSRVSFRLWAPATEKVVLHRQIAYIEALGFSLAKSGIQAQGGDLLTGVFMWKHQDHPAPDRIWPDSDISNPGRP